MRRVVILSLVLILLTAGTSLAEKKQIDEGSIVVGGVSSLALLTGSTKIEPEDGDSMTADTTLVALMGYGGYFLQKGIEVGPILGFGYGKAEVDEDGLKTTNTVNVFDIGIQAGYLYEMSKKDDWLPFGMMSLEYMSGKFESTYEMPPAKEVKNTGEISGYSVMPRGGIMFFLHDRIALDLSVFIKYVSASGSTENGDKQNLDLTSTNYGILIGIDGFLN